MTGVNSENWVIRRDYTLPAVPGNDVLQFPPRLSVSGGSCNATVRNLTLPPHKRGDHPPSKLDWS